MPTYDDGLNVLVLGPVALAAGAGIGGLQGQQGHVLALLAAAHPHPVDIDTIVDELWPDRPPRTAETGLRVVLTRLRRRLTDGPGQPDGPDGGAPDLPSTGDEADRGADIVNEGRSYRLVIDADRVDHRRFQAAVTAAATDDDPVRAADRLIPALELWRGPAFQPYGDARALQPVASGLDLARLDAEELLVESLLRSARPDAAASWATRFVESQPYRERRWEQLMLALYRSGRQSEALDAGHRATSILREELGIEPGAGLRSLERDILDQAEHLDQSPAPDGLEATESISVDDFVTSLAPAAGPIPNPARGTFVGRADEEAEVVKLLDRVRLLSITGPPGVGKTRLARQVAITSAGRRTIWLDLVGADPDTVVTRLATAVDLRIGDRAPGPAVAEVIASTPTLLVLDNCEHLVEAVAELSEALIAACPDLVVLTTSRIALQSPSESTVPLEPLPSDDAIRLLRGCLPARASGRFDDRELLPLVECLDGLPLSLELAAPTLNVISPEQLVQQLANSLDPAAGRGRADPRHRSLDAAVSWSVDLLEPADRTLFESLGPLHGAFATADVGGLTGREAADVEAGLSRLAAAGLVRTARLDDGAAGWTQLNVVRTHARRRLIATERLAGLEREAAESYCGLMESLAPGLEGPDEARSVTRLRRSADQLAATHRWLVQHGEVERAAAFGLGTWEFSFFRQDYAAYGRLEDVIGLAGADELPDADELFGQASLAAWAGDRFEAALVLAERAEALANGWGRPVPLAAMKTRHLVAVHERRPEAGPLLLALVEASGQRSDHRHHADNLTVAAIALAHLGRLDQAGAAADESVELADATGNPTSISWARVGRAMVDLERDPASAARTLSSARRLARTVDNRWVGQMAITGMVTALRRMDRRVEARRLLADVIGRWARANSIGQVWRCCQEAVLLLEADGELQPAADLHRRLVLADHAYPVSAEERDLWESVGARLQGVQPGATAIGLPIDPTDGPADGDGVASDDHRIGDGEVGGAPSAPGAVSLAATVSAVLRP